MSGRDPPGARRLPGVERAREQPRPHEREPEPERAGAKPGPAVVVRGQTDVDRAERRAAVVLWTLAAVGLSAAATLDPYQATVAWSLALGAGVAGAADRLLIGPLVRFGRRLGAESARLRAALACPYCKDTLPEDAAIACDRKGCGAFYHEECWAEVGAAYGGCAIYGCGCKTGHAVGRFALRRHVLRLLLAAALFPPRIVKRIQETERQSFRDVWRRAREFQGEVSRSPVKTIGAGLGYLVIAAALALALGQVTEAIGGRSRGDEVAWFVLAVWPLAIILIPLLLIRLPLTGHFAWGLWRVVGRVFRDELAALGRADQGTFLARLAGGAGKKDAAGA